MKKAYVFTLILSIVLLPSCAEKPNITTSTVVASDSPTPEGGSPSGPQGQSPQGPGNQGPGGQNQGPGGGQTQGPGPGETVSPEELKECAEKGGAQGSIRVVSSKENIKVASGGSIAIKLTGNQPEVVVTLMAEEGARFGTVCIFQTANFSKAVVKALSDLDGLYLKQRGNQPLARLEFAEEASPEKFVVDISGNKAKVIVKGSPRPTSLSIKGNAEGIFYE